MKLCITSESAIFLSVGIWYTLPPSENRAKDEGIKRPSHHSCLAGRVAQMHVTAPCAGAFLTLSPLSRRRFGTHTQPVSGEVAIHTSPPEEEGWAQEQRPLGCCTNYRNRAEFHSPDADGAADLWRSKAAKENAKTWIGPRQEKNGIMHMTLGNDACWRPHLEEESVRSLSEHQLSKHRSWAPLPPRKCPVAFLSRPAYAVAQMPPSPGPVIEQSDEEDTSGL